MVNFRPSLLFGLAAVLLIVSLGISFVPPLFSLDRQGVLSIVVPRESCASLSICPLHEGDILIRRQLNPNTEILEKFNMYLNHIAYYLGDDEIVAAVGDTPNSSEEIVAETLSQSDWMSTTTELWVVIRPVIAKEKINNISGKLREIASDERYSFGFFESWKQKTCTNFIYDELVREGLISKEGGRILTPDFMLDHLSKSAQFEILTHGTGSLK